jgi:hypothetical protein
MKEVILIFGLGLAVLLLLFGAYMLTSDNNITTVQIPQEVIFRMALEYHGIEEAYINTDINCFYFERDGQHCKLFTTEFERWVLSQPIVDSYYR